MLGSRILAVTAIGLSLCGCLPEAQNPVALPSSDGGDARLLGAWLHVSEDGYGVYHAFKTDRADWDFIIADHDVEGFGGIETYSGHTSSLPSGDYVNLLVTGSESGYLILRYEFVDKDRLRVAISSTEVLVEAVRSGHLPGDLTEDATGPDIRISATPEQWQAYLAGAPSGLFDESFELERVGPALLAE